MEIRGARPALATTQWDTRLRIGEAILVSPTENMKLLHRRLVEAGACVVAPPVRIEVPGRPQVHEMMVRDPDGLVVNLTQRGLLR